MLLEMPRRVQERPLPEVEIVDMREELENGNRTVLSSALRKALKETIGGCTFIIVAQRINTILDADQIIVLDDGKIAGMGTHKELLASCEIYKEIALSQLSEEELSKSAASGKEVS